MGEKMRSLAIALACASIISGCGAVDYYWQSVHGQYDLLTRAKPLREAINTTSDARLRERLQLAERIRAFASHDLDLPSNGSYRRYADLGRPFVIWNVFAAPQLSLAPHEWCYPIAGCVNYRGYFSEQDAHAEAALLATAGEDVYIGGVPAYSTLGWFDDPILSSFVRYPETEFARLIFHELAHQLLYVKDDTVFNESYATALSDVGLLRWIAAQPPELRAKLEAERARNQRLRGEFQHLVVRTRDTLLALYSSDAPDAVKAQHKDAAFATVRANYESAKRGQPGLAGFDRWFAGYENRGPNNASLAAIALYTERVPAFRALIAEVHGNLPAFYARVRQLAALDKPARDAALDSLAHSPSVRAAGAVKCEFYTCALPHADSSVTLLRHPLPRISP